MLASLEATAAASARIYNKLSHDAKPAFFQLVHHPVRATLTLANLWISAGINNLRASQARLSANDYFDEVQKFFEDDYALEVDYHSILNGMSFDLVEMATDRCGL